MGDLLTERRRDRRVGLVYDERMCKHFEPDEEPHPECPDRITAIWNKLQASGITQRCVVLDAKEAEDKYIESVHSKSHIKLIKNISSKQFDARRNQAASRFNSIYFNEGSSEAAYLAAGSVMEVAEGVSKGELDSGFAIVRPPGHHCEENEPMGFCLFNNVAIATSYLLNEREELGINKILIVDWDVHHGNATQKMFWNDPRVLFFSVHRHEFGSFYPANDDGDYNMIGGGAGVGYNINVPWENGRCGDPDYLAVWDNILIPVAKDFNPDLIIISAGFDAAAGDPLGGCRVTPFGYSLMLKKLMNFAEGKIVMSLEGGYNLDSLAKSVLACMEVLLEDKPIAGSSEAYPFESTWRVIQAVRRELSAYWPSLADELPTKLTSCKAAPHLLILSSDSESENEEASKTVLEGVDNDVQDIIFPLAQLKVNEDSHGQLSSVSCGWRSELSKVDVWYASFGSNMYTPRFLCYITGGMIEGMRRRCQGSLDPSPPKEIKWKMVPHRLFFGRDATVTWGAGGVAFLSPKSDNEDAAHVCLYRITLEQFNDVLLQENNSTQDTDAPYFDMASLNSINSTRCFEVESLMKGWYHNVLYLGKEGDIPILTMTCSFFDTEKYKLGKIPVCPPAKEYANTLIKGLVKGNRLPEEEAVAYIKEASAKPL